MDFRRMFWPVSRWVIRQLMPAGLVSASSAGRMPVLPEYPVENAMSTLSRFPWVWTAVRAVALDLAGLPLVAVPKRSGRNRRQTGRAEFLEDAALERLEEPNPGCDGWLFRAQLAVDWLCTGNAYIWDAPDGSGLYRIHPKSMHPVPGPMGLVAYYSHKVDSGQDRRIPVNQVIHLRDISWQDGPQSLIGESAVRALHDDLLREMGGRRLAAEQANKGHPDVIFSIKGNAGPKKAQEIDDRWEDARQRRQSAFSLYDDVTVTPLSWSPQDMQLAESSSMTREAVLAVFEVPPARAGIEGANYGTQRQQMRTYWESLIRRSTVFDKAFSKLARPGVSIEHDFSAVESLQVSYTERLMRVSTWVGLGAEPAQAAAYEQFVDAPLPSGPARDFSPAVPIDRQPEEPQEDRDQASTPAPISAALAHYLEEAQPRYLDMWNQERGGADIAMLLKWETERLFSVLEFCRLPRSDARWWAEELTEETMEAVRSAGTVEIQAFGLGRAARAAHRIAA